MSLVFAGVCSHAPGITGRAHLADPALKDPFHAEFRALGVSLAAARPDALIIIAAEHFANFFMNNMPAYAIGMAAHYEGPAGPEGAVGELRERILGALGSLLDLRTQPGVAAVARPPSLAAYRHWSVGMEHFYRNEFREAVAELDQQVLAGVGHPLEVVERQEAARALDGVDRAEDAAEQLARAGCALEGDEVAVQLVQVLVALHEELLDDVVHALHSALRGITTRSIT